MSEENFGPISGSVDITLNGVDYVVKAPSIETRGTLKNTFTKIRNTRMLTAVLDLSDSLPKKQYDQLYQDTIKATGRTLSEQDYLDVVQSDEGVVASLWLLFEQSYPGKVTKSDIAKFIEDGKIDKSKAVELFTLYNVASGELGNSRGPEAGQDSPNQP